LIMGNRRTPVTPVPFLNLPFRVAPDASIARMGEHLDRLRYGTVDRPGGNTPARLVFKHHGKVNLNCLYSGSRWVYGSVAAGQSREGKRMQIKDNGVLCECGTHHTFDSYYYAHTHVQLTVHCDCGNSCTLKHDRIVAQVIKRKEGKL